MTLKVQVKVNIYKYANSHYQITLTVKGSQKLQEAYKFGVNATNNYPHRFQKLCSFPTFPDRAENKTLYRSLKLFNILKNILQITIEVLGFHKKMCEAIGDCRTTQSSFSRWKVGCMKKRKHQISMASCHRFSLFFHHVFGKVNKNYRDDLDIIDHGHRKQNISHFCLYFAYLE